MLVWAEIKYRSYKTMPQNFDQSISMQTVKYAMTQWAVIYMYSFYSHRGVCSCKTSSCVHQSISRTVNLNFLWEKKFCNSHRKHSCFSGIITGERYEFNVLACLCGSRVLTCIFVMRWKFDKLMDQKNILNNY